MALRRMGFERPDSLMGCTVELVAAGLDVRRLMRLFSSPGLPGEEEVLAPRRAGDFGVDVSASGVWSSRHAEHGYVTRPDKASRTSLMDIVAGFQAGVATRLFRCAGPSVEMVEPLVENFEAIGYGTFTVLNELKELKKGSSSSTLSLERWVPLPWRWRRWGSSAPWSCPCWNATERWAS